jgi:outer membrane lipoprotein SlyB
MFRFTMQRCFALIVIAAFTVAACAPVPTYSVQQPTSRAGVVEGIRSQTVQTANPTAGAVVGGLAGGGIGNMIGGGTGRTVATIVGAVGGAVVGHKIAENAQELVWIIDVRYDDGTIATIQQKGAPNLRIGDRVLVTPGGIELLR